MVLVVSAVLGCGYWLACAEDVFLCFFVPCLGFPIWTAAWSPFRISLMSFRSSFFGQICHPQTPTCTTYVSSHKPTSPVNQHQHQVQASFPPSVPHVDPFFPGEIGHRSPDGFPRCGSPQRGLRGNAPGALERPGTTRAAGLGGGGREFSSVGEDGRVVVRSG